MGEWPVVPLEELAAREKSAISKPFGSAILKEDYRAQGVPIVRGVNVGRAVFHDGDFVFIDKKLASRMPGAVMRAGDLVITHRGTVGQVSMIPRNSRYEEYVASTSHVKVRLDSRTAHPEFYLYWFHSPRGLRSILDNASVVGVPGLVQPVATVKRLQVPLPPLSEQRAIAEVLGALDNKIAANERVVATLDSLAASSAEAAFTVAKVAVAQVASIIMGSSPPGSSYNERQIGTPFYQGVRDFGVRFPRRRVWTSQPVRLAVPGDTLLSVRAPVGRVNLASEDLCLGRGLAALRSRTRTPITLFHQLKSSRGVWEPYEAEGTVFGAISRAQLGSIALPEVDPLEVESLEKRLTTLEDCLAVTLSENRALAAARDALLPLLMSGRLRVKDAEKVVAEVV